MDSGAVWIGLIGAIIQIFYKVNGFGFKGSVAVIISGSVLAGYVMPLLLQYVGQSAAFLLTFLIGYTSASFFKWLNNVSPELLRLAGEMAKQKIKKHGNDK